MKKVLIIDNSVDMTGAFRSIVSAIQSIHAIEFHFGIQKSEPINKRLKQLGLPSITIPFIEISRSLKALLYLPALLLNTVRVLRLMEKEEISVIHVNDMYNMCGVLAKRFSPSIRLIYHVRLLPTSYAGRLYSLWRKLILRYADNIICVSNSVRKCWPDNYKVQVIHDSINLPESLPPKEVRNSNDLTFFYLANYISGKGQADAILAFKQALEELENAKLVFAGSDMGSKRNIAYKQSLLNTAKSIGIEHKIHFKDAISDIEVSIKAADIMLNFSESESFSMTCLEALYFGTPCIATDSGGPSEIIQHGDSGILVPVGDIELMAAAMVELGKSLELRQKFSINGRRRARDIFGVEASAQKLERIYNL